MSIGSIRLTRTGKQIDQAILGRNSWRRFGGRQQSLHSPAAAFEDIALVLHFRKMAEDSRERAIRVAGSDGSLAFEYLPESREPLQNSGGVGTQALVANFTGGRRDIQKLIASGVRNLWPFGEKGVFRAQLAGFTRPPVGC